MMKAKIVPAIKFSLEEALNTYKRWYVGSNLNS
jgi:hypothetical protein